MSDLKLIALLMRRAGFGAAKPELEDYLSIGYEGAVERLLDPGEPNNLPDDLVRRYHVDQSELRQLDGAGSYWLYRMITTANPLEEKMALFWHGLFATGYSKLNQARALLNQIDMFRTYGLGSFKTLLVELSKDPAMILWLDNNDNHKDAINENYGRELLELFSMGIGSYSEEDIKECAKAFTGWTLKNSEYMSMRASKDSIWPYGRISWHYEYREEDHDESEKHFLGERGNFNGSDVIDIITRQEATARFLCTRLFQFFGSDDISDAGNHVIESMMEEYFRTDYEVSSVLRILFNSDYFKSNSARYAKVKGPVESVVGIARLSGAYSEPTLDVGGLWSQAMYMGQGLLAPPTVEGWHEGTEWIDSGALVERVNFASRELGNPLKPGVHRIIQRIIDDVNFTGTPSEIVDSCLDEMGRVEVDSSTREVLLDFASSRGKFDLNLEDSDIERKKIADTMSMIASTREYQLA